MDIFLWFFFYNLPTVGALNPDYYGLLESLTSSSVIDVNMEHETLRLKQGWETWIIPNSDGTRGVPRYIKQQLVDEVGVEMNEEESESGNGATSNPEPIDVNTEEISTEGDSTRMRSGSGAVELSASAPVFSPGKQRL